MLDIFEKDTLYIFDERKYYIHNGKKFNWTNLCDGLIVDVENEFIGTITVDGEEYVVFPQFCYPVEVDVISREEKNIYGNKIFFGIDKNDHWTDAGFSLLDNLEDKSINNHSEELTFDKSKKYYFSMNLVAKKDMEDWMYCCDGSLVDVIDINKGFVLDSWEDEYHIVVRKWCKEK